MSDKAFAYITHGIDLLVLRHPDFPEAGIQVPAGTIETGEAPDAAVMREAFEETGLTNLKMKGFLGKCHYDMSAWGGDPSQNRYFFHVELEDEVPASWQHKETNGGKAEPIVFEFYWVRIPDEIPELIAGHGQMLAALIAKQYLSI